MYTGIVVNRNDPMKVGRCQVRIVGVHTHDRSQLRDEDLPWAIPSQPITSAAISGIGSSPVGPVEGTWVLIVFADEPYNQQPIMLGTLAGIPQDDGVVDAEGYDGVVTVDDDGELPPEATPSDKSVVQKSTGDLRHAREWTISEDGIALIKGIEQKRLEAYLDSAGVPTIGYGLTKIDGQPVFLGQTITNEKAESSFREYINEVAVPDVQGGVKTLITQSMFDALCSFTYNLGGPKARKSSVYSTINNSDYSQCAAEFLSYTKDSNGNSLSGLSKRREAEKNLFLKDGLPTTTTVTTTSNGLQQGTGTTTRTVLNPQPSQGANGFTDPNGKYPRYRFEPDTNRLARHERIDTTSVRKKELERERDVVTAGGYKWSQSYVPYNAQYPFNQVYESESGHVLEFDDTPNCERINFYHRKGTFFEIDANGTRVTKVVGDNYEILERNGFIYIKGEANVTIDGATRVKVNNTLQLDVVGKTTVNVFNHCDLNVSGNLNASVKENFSLKAKSVSIESYGGDTNILSSGNANIKANTINQSGGTINHTGNTINVRADTYNETVDGDASYAWNGDKHTWTGGDTYERHDSGTDFACPGDPGRSGDVDCSDVDEADTANAASATGLLIPAPVQTPIVLSQNTLTVLTRGAEAAKLYETPEEGDPSAYINRRIKKGTLDPTMPEPNKQAQSSGKSSNVPIPPQSCAAIFAMDRWDNTFQLSKKVNLSAMTKGGSRPVREQFGLSKQQIICNMKGLSENCLDPILTAYPNAIITSGFRRPGDVKASSRTSQHYLGEAADLVFQGFTNEQVYNAAIAIEKMIPYDQLLLEYDGAAVWLHVSFKYSSPRKQYFTMKTHKRISSNGTFILLA